MSISIFEKKINPFFQAAGILVFGLIFLGFGILGEQNGIFREDPMFPWIIMTTIVLAFSIFNCVFSIAYDKQGQYWLKSFIAFGLVVVLGGLIATWVSGIPIDEAKSIKWIYIVLSMCYFIFLAIVRTMRKIVLIAQKQDARLRGESSRSNKN